MIRKHYSLVHADKVLKIVKRLMHKVEIDGSIRAWSNGREQGYAIQIRTHDYFDNRTVCFAEQRNSDAVVVVYGPSIRFDISTNQPDEELWATNRHDFAEDEDAAQFIVHWLEHGETALTMDKIVKMSEAKP
jgi:hypothetical protein